MAAQDYYGSPYKPTRREDAPLPPVPSRSSSGLPGSPSYQNHHISVSPPDSPFADQNTYPTYPKSSQQSSQQNLMPHDTSYSGYGGRPDPFADNNAIPMQNAPGKGSNDSMLRVQDPEGYFDSRRRKEKKQKNGWFTGRIPWVVYGLTVIQIGVFVGEIIRNSTLTGSPIEIHPTFNPMIGPSPYVLINMGSRFVPCMRVQPGLDASLPIPCANTTDNDPICSLGELCGFGGFDADEEPNQWFRFIVPIFLHAGIIHIGFNMLLQITLGRDMEREIGSIRFFLIYFSAGIFGFVFGGNFAPAGIAPVGASGALFGILALTLLSLLYTWKQRRSPGKDLTWIIVDVVISFALGLLPGFDNFSHIGGFLMGLVLGICVLHSPNSLRQRTHQDHPPYTPMSPGDGRLNTEIMARGKGAKGFIKDPLGFFKGRVGWWWAWWLIRVGALVLVLVVFIVLLNNFYVSKTQCSWCKYLSCIDINDWCDIGQLQVKNQTKRDLGLNVFDVGTKFAQLDFMS